MTSSDTMQALVLHAVGDARLEEIPVPPVTSGQVRVRVGSCGVCGSDIPRIFVKGTYHFPTVCGHEFSGTVESCAEDVTDFQVGVKHEQTPTKVALELRYQLAAAHLKEADVGAALLQWEAISAAATEYRDVAELIQHHREISANRYL